MRAIDWKATARLKRPIAREYQDERDQQIVFMLDTGRRMLAKDSELSHFDQALNVLRAKGVMVEDCLSDELPAAITNRYLAIKRAGIL